MYYLMPFLTTKAGVLFKTFDQGFSSAIMRYSYAQEWKLLTLELFSEVLPLDNLAKKDKSYMTSHCLICGWQWEWGVNKQNISK